MDWPGVRVMQDNAIGKPVGAKSLGYHQDNAYLGWFKPGEICTVWIALDDVEAQNGAMELVRGSHRWQHSQPEGEFHAPQDYRAPMLKFADIEGVDPEIVAVAVPGVAGQFIMAGPGMARAQTKAITRAARWFCTRCRVKSNSFAKTFTRVPAQFIAAMHGWVLIKWVKIIFRLSGAGTAIALEPLTAYRLLKIRQ